MSSPQKKQEKRPRGRPKGTTKFEKEDLRVLVKFADIALLSKHAKLAPFLRDQGYDFKDIRRAQNRWKQNKQSLLEEARLRRDSAPAESILDLIAFFVNASSALAETAAPALEAIAFSLEKAKRRRAALKDLKLDPNLPLDLSNTEAVERAIRQYDETFAKNVHPTEFGERTLKGLPQSLKLYAAALMMHQLSIQMAESEAKERNANRQEHQRFPEGET